MAESNNRQEHPKRRGIPPPLTLSLMEAEGYRKGYLKGNGEDLAVLQPVIPVASSSPQNEDCELNSWMWGPTLSRSVSPILLQQKEPTIPEESLGAIAPPVGATVSRNNLHTDTGRRGIREVTPQWAENIYVGIIFGNLKIIPTDYDLDPPMGACFNCRVMNAGHSRRECVRQNGPLTLHCYNCGRLDTVIDNCPRCAEENLRRNQEFQRKKNEEAEKRRIARNVAACEQEERERAKRQAARKQLELAARNRLMIEARRKAEETARQRAQQEKEEEERRIREEQRKLEEQRLQKEREETAKRKAEIQRAQQLRLQLEEILGEIKTLPTQSRLQAAAYLAHQADVLKRV